MEASLLVDWVIYVLPLLMVVLMGGSLVVYKIRHFRAGGVSPFSYAAGCCLGVVDDYPQREG